jgi:hypothetical protein
MSRDREAVVWTRLGGYSAGYLDVFDSDEKERARVSPPSTTPPR